MPKRSEEVQDIIDRMPTRWTLWTVMVITILVSVMLFLSFVIEYPDTVDGEISLTGQTAPVRLVAGTTGRMHLLLERGATVHPGSIIAYIENGVDYNSYLYLESLLATQEQPTTFRTDLEFGELGISYNAWMISCQNWKRLEKSNRYANERTQLAAQIKGGRKEEDNARATLALQRRIRANLAEQIRKDSILLKQGIISKYEFQNNQNAYLSQAEAYLNLQTSHNSKQTDIQRGQLQIARSHLEEQETLDEAFADMKAKRNTLQNELRLWKEKYLFVATSKGELDYLNFWRENTMIRAGEEAFTIIPAKNKVIGEAVIPSTGAGKIKSGQIVNVKLNDFPYDEYGMLIGKVESISQLSNTTEIQQRRVNTYLVRIAFPYGLQTNFGKTLSLNFESKGTAEILTKPRRLIERLFDNLKSQSSK